VSPPAGTDWLGKLVPDAVRQLEDPEAKQAVAALEALPGQAKEALDKLGAFMPTKEGTKPKEAEDEEDKASESGTIGGLKGQAFQWAGPVQQGRHGVGSTFRS